MLDYEKSLELAPYALAKDEKREFLTGFLKDLTEHHIQLCHEYSRIMSAEQYEKEAIESYEDIPFLPVRLFKEVDMRSVGSEAVVKTMTSSGTTGQQVSKIYLDKKTSALQTKTLAKIVSDFIGNKRLPMLILDSSAVIKDRKMFSARGAGILGFSVFGRDKVYALDENMQLDVEGIRAFLEKHKGEKIFLFGFTFMIWQYFCAELEKSDYHPDLSNGILIHGGGWKKLSNLNISSADFKKRLFDVCKLEKIYDYYGMVEQTGTIYMECECGHLHTSSYGDVIVRRYHDFSVADIGEEGLIETISILPWSYPGHVLLTEDRGVWLGEDDCPCGRKGKYFKVLGRVHNAEVRGCSDTYETK